jgi:hypothetical protein
VRMCERAGALKSDRKRGWRGFRSLEVGWRVSVARKLGTWIGGG